jgi:hypothetical protein
VADADFFFDPVCPWAWITSRWVKEVGDQRPLDVDWRFIALRMVNEGRDYDTEFPPKYREGHTLGLRLLRVAAAAKAEGGSQAVDRIYTVFGSRIHVDRRRAELDEGVGIEAALAEAGMGGGLAAAADDEAWDGVIRHDTETALERAGADVGTPILTFAPPDGPSFFGPVISRIPRGPEAVDLWESTEHIARFPGFAELKRSIREKPQTS